MEKDLTVDSVSLQQNCSSGLLRNKPSSYVPCKLNDYRMQGVIDSNVSVCGVNPNTVGKLNVHVEPVQRGQLITGDGHVTIMLGKFLGVISLRGNNYPTEIVVMEGLRDVLLLGKEFCIQAHLIPSTVVSSVVTKDEKSLKVCKPPEVKEQDHNCYPVQNLAVKDCVNQSSVTRQHYSPLLLENSVTTQNPIFPLTQNVTHNVVLPQLQNKVTKQQDLVVQVFQKPLNGQCHSFDVSLIHPTCIVPCNCPYIQLHPCHCQVEGKCAQCKNTQSTEMDSQVFTIKELRRIRDKIKRKLNLKKRKRPSKRKRTKPVNHDVSSTVLVILDSKDTDLIENLNCETRQTTKQPPNLSVQDTPTNLNL